MDMYPTEKAQERMSNIIKHVKAGRITEEEANDSALVVILMLKIDLAEAGV